MGALGCFCETGLAGPGSAECTASVADLTTCSEAPVGACNKVSQSPCVPALLTDSGVNKAATISATSDADLSAWCRWRTCLGGGPGHIPIYCDHNRASATIPSVEDCVADLKQTFGGCAATLAGGSQAAVSASSTEAAALATWRVTACLLAAKGIRSVPRAFMAPPRANRRCAGTG